MGKSFLRHAHIFILAVFLSTNRALFILKKRSSKHKNDETLRLKLRNVRQNDTWDWAVSKATFFIFRFCRDIIARGFWEVSIRFYRHTFSPCSSRVVIMSNFWRQAGKILLLSGRSMGKYVASLTNKARRFSSRWKERPLRRSWHYPTIRNPVRDVDMYTISIEVCFLIYKRLSFLLVGLSQRYILLQIYLPAVNSPLSVEFGITDTHGNRRRLMISSAFRDTVLHQLHVQVG